MTDSNGRVAAALDTQAAIAQIEPYWFSRPEAEIRAAVEARPEQWAPVPGYTRYLWSDKGRLRPSPNGDVMKTRVLNSGYESVKVVRDRDGERPDVLVHQMVLLAHHPAFAGLAAFPAGLETRHNPAIGDKRFNAYPEGIWPGTKRQNTDDRPDPGGTPQFPCRNATTLNCPNAVLNEGRRCADCTRLVGFEAAVLLRLHVNLMAVARLFGYTHPDWVFKLAVKHGSYAGTKAEALAQQPGLVDRMRARSFMRGDHP